MLQGLQYELQTSNTLS